MLLFCMTVRKVIIRYFHECKKILKNCLSGILDKKQFIKLFIQLESTEKKIEKYAEFVFNGNVNYEKIINLLI
jgi:hypothetical protein